MAKSSKQMIGAVLKGTVGQMMANRQVSKPIWNMSSNTHKYQKHLLNNLQKKVSSNAMNVARKDTCDLSVQN